MRILIDECLPRELGNELVGHDVKTVPQVGWAGVNNGQLMGRVSGNFDRFVTIDKRIERDQAVPKDVALITVRARSNRIQDLLPLVPELLRAVNETPRGKSTRVGA